MKNNESHLKKIRKIAAAGVASLALVIPLAISGVSQVNTNVHADEIGGIYVPHHQVETDKYEISQLNHSKQYRQEQINSYRGDAMGIIKDDRGDFDTSYGDYFDDDLDRPNSSDAGLGKEVKKQDLHFKKMIKQSLAKTIKQGILWHKYNKGETKRAEKALHFYPTKRMFAKAKVTKRKAWNHRPFYDLYGDPNFFDSSPTLYRKIGHNQRANYNLGANQLGSSQGSQLSKKEMDITSANSMNKAYDYGYLMTAVSDGISGGTRREKINYAKHLLKVLIAPLQKYHRSHSKMFKEGYLHGQSGYPHDINKKLYRTNKNYRNGWKTSHWIELNI